MTTLMLIADSRMRRSIYMTRSRVVWYAASCDPTGARPVGVHDSEELLVDRSSIWRDHWLAGSVPAWRETGGVRTLYQPRYLSDNGRVFFDSSDALVPQDTNGLEDVYEYEPLELVDVLK